MAREALIEGGSLRGAAALAVGVALVLSIGGAVCQRAHAHDLGTGACAIPDTILTNDIALPHVAARLKAGQPIKIVAIGSSSTSGAGASSPDRTYPARLGVELRQRFPEARIEVINKGIGGQRTAAMVARFDRDVFANQPDLVIWQVGTNSIIQRDGTAGAETAIDDGVRRLKASDVDVILMDPQFAPKVTADPDYPEMLRILAGVSRLEQVMMFPRFAIMRHWVTSGQLTLESMLSPDGLHMNDLSYGCIAGLLADQIEQAVRGGAAQLIATPRPRP